MPDQWATLVVIIDSLRQGGAERSTALFLSDAVQKWRRVVLISFGQESDPFLKQVRDAGVEVHFLRFGFFVLDVLNLRRKLNETKPSAIYTVLYKSALRARFASLCGPSPLIEALVGFRHLPLQGETFIRRIKRRVHRLFDRTTASWCVDKFHANSESIRKHYIKEFSLTADKIEVVPRGRSEPPRLDSASRAQVRREIFGIDESAQLLLLVGRTDEVKNFILVAKAAPDIQRKIPCQVVFAIVGRSGAQQRAIDLELNSNGASSAFRKLGFRADVTDLMQCADALIIPSVSEGLPGVAIEALACRLPVIHSDISACQEVLGGLPSAFQFSSGRTESLTQAALDWFTTKSSGQSDTDLGFARFMQRYGLSEANHGLNLLIGSCVRGND